MSTKKVYNPADKIAEFKKKTADRGYGHFSAKAVELAREKNMNAKVDQSVCQSMAEDSVANLMASVNNIQDPDHPEAREKYYKKYEGDPKKAFDIIYEKLCADNGIGQLPQRDSDYEKTVLQTGRNMTANEQRDHLVFSQLMNAAWDFGGYDQDPAIISEFNKEYKNKRTGADGSAAPGSAVANKMKQLQDRNQAAQQ